VAGVTRRSSKRGNAMWKGLDLGKPRKHRVLGEGGEGERMKLPKYWQRHVSCQTYEQGEWRVAVSCFSLSPWNLHVCTVHFCMCNLEVAKKIYMHAAMLSKSVAALFRRPRYEVQGTRVCDVMHTSLTDAPYGCSQQTKPTSPLANKKYIHPPTDLRPPDIIYMYMYNPTRLPHAL